MAAPRHRSASSRGGRYLHHAIFLVATAFALFGSRSTRAQVQCTTVVTYYGYLEYGDIDLPAASETLCYLPFFCGYTSDPGPWEKCMRTDIDGRFEHTDSIISGVWHDTTSYGGTVSYDVRARCRDAFCQFVVSWDAFIVECHAPYFSSGTWYVGTIDLEKHGGVPLLPAPEQLYEPYFYEPENAYAFTWSSVPSARTYFLRIDTSASTSIHVKPWKTVSMASPAALISDPPKQFSWRVRAANSCSLSVWTSPKLYLALDGVVERDVPSSFGLAQNYPNPFNSTTIIRFNLEAATDWTLSIYNILGQVVRRYSGPEAIGPQQVEWYGDDGIGVPVASGMYFYRLETRNRTDSRKMTLLR